MLGNFVSKCYACNFTDERFHNTGVAEGSRDPGRAAVTGDPGDLGAFRTPSLRDVTRTAPYMHDGSFATLEAVIDFYDGGGRPRPNRSPEVRLLRLSEVEKEALLAFLRALESPAASCSPISCFP